MPLRSYSTHAPVTYPVFAKKTLFIEQIVFPAPTDDTTVRDITSTELEQTVASTVVTSTVKPVSTNVIFPTSPKIILKPTKLTGNFSKYNIPVANNSEVKFPVLQTVQTLPPLIILSPKPTESIVEKVLPKNITNVVKVNKTKIDAHKPIADRSENDVEKNVKEAFDDMLPVPSTMGEETTKILIFESTTAVYNDVTNSGGYHTFPCVSVATIFFCFLVDHESNVENELEQYYGDNGTVNELVIKEKPALDAKFFAVLGGVAVFILLGVILGISIARKRSFISCVGLRRKMRNNANGDSQSDVRVFLDSNEELNFTWVRSNESSNF